VGCVISALTDNRNRNRTGAQVRHLVSKLGAGELLLADNLAYLFQRVGMIQVVEGVHDEDDLLESALEGGATNVEQDDEGRGNFMVYNYGRKGNLASCRSSAGFRLPTDTI
jgi:transcriptional/translational regulatory protein YebC/TACO1